MKNSKNKIRIKAKGYNIKEVKPVISIEEQTNFMEKHVKGIVKGEKDNKNTGT